MRRKMRRKADTDSRRLPMEGVVVSDAQTSAHTARSSGCSQRCSGSSQLRLALATQLLTSILTSRRRRFLHSSTKSTVINAIIITEFHPNYSTTTLMNYKMIPSSQHQLPLRAQNSCRQTYHEQRIARGLSRLVCARELVTMTTSI